jgi:hypothetical protein
MRVKVLHARPTIDKAEKHTKRDGSREQKRLATRS